MITHYGYDNFFALCATAATISALAYFLIGGIWAIPFYILSAVITLFALWFFRDPARTIAPEALSNEKILVAPADGKIVQLCDVGFNEFIGGEAKQVSVFLSPLDVHVNRVPSSGTIIFADYKPGKYLVAFDHKASEENEQSIIGLENSHGNRYIFKQITGFLARRIVYHLKAGDKVKAGDQYGMMKFGSRMDIILPAATEFLVKEGDVVVGGESLLARLPK